MVDPFLGFGALTLPPGFGGEGIGQERRLTERIIGCIVKVHRTLGPGFVEAIYRRALVIELRRCGLQVEVEKEVAAR